MEQPRQDIGAGFADGFLGVLFGAAKIVATKVHLTLACLLTEESPVAIDNLHC